MQVGPSLLGPKYQTHQEVTLGLSCAISLSLGKGIRHKFAKLKQLISCLLLSQWKFCYWLQQARISLQRMYYGMGSLCFYWVLRKLNWHLWLSQGRCWFPVLLYLCSCHAMMSCQKITGFGTMSLTGEMYCATQGFMLWWAHRKDEEMGFILHMLSAL